MKKLKILWSLLALPLIVASCSDKDVLNSGSGNEKIPEGDGVYMSVNIVPFNEGTRSYTSGDNSSNGGTEVGSTDENKIKKVLIVLTDKDNNFIASSLVDGKNNSTLTPPATDPNNNVAYQAKAKFAKTTIANYYKQVGVNNTQNIPINVFIYCNPTEALVTKFNGSTDTQGNEWYNWTEPTPSTLWDTSDGFLMTNVSIASRLLPASLETWNMFSDEGNPFNLSGMNNASTDLQVDNTAGSIKVHRMAARFDFRDGSQGLGDADPVGNGIKGENFTYKVMVNKTGGVRVKAKLINMSLVNLLREEYYLERVSTKSKASEWNANSNLLGAEQAWYSDATGTPIQNSGNYVVTPNASNRGYNLIRAFSTYYNYPLFTDEGTLPDRGMANGSNQWFTESVEKVCSGRTDGSGNYHVWRYVTENTEGEGANSNEPGQVNGSSTGIVFKAQLLAGDALTGEGADYWDKQLNKTLSNVGSDGPVLFAFSNNLYCSWKHVQYAAIVESGYDGTAASLNNLDRATTFYKSVFGNGGFGTLTFPADSGLSDITDPDQATLGEDDKSANYLHDKMGSHDDGVTDNKIFESDAWKAFRDKVVSDKFSIYRKYGETTGTGDSTNTTWGYYCYYYYWNRHNNNGLPGVMAPMEFAVVRNNIYKLAVTKINTLGHPRLPDNDPDSPTPNTPDEKSDVYMEVSVQVLPWVIRVNDIEF